MKIDKQTIFEIHRLNDLCWTERKIARHLRISRPSVNKYFWSMVEGWATATF